MSSSPNPPNKSSDQFYDIPLDVVEQTKPNTSIKQRTNVNKKINKPNSQPTTKTMAANLVSVSEPSFVNLKLAQHMTIAGGFLDFALFVADVEHLKFILDTGKDNVKYYTLLLTLLIVSLLLQLVVVILLMVVGFRKPTTPIQSNRQTNTVNANGEISLTEFDSQTVTTHKEGVILNNIIIAMVSLVAIVNVFITVFGDRSETVLMARYKADMARFNRTVDPYH